MKTTLLIVALSLLPTMAAAQQAPADILDGTYGTAGIGITPNGTGSGNQPTQTILTLSTQGAAVNGGVDALVQGATAGNPCKGYTSGTTSYDATNDQMIYCSVTGVWTAFQKPPQYVSASYTSYRWPSAVATCPQGTLVVGGGGSCTGGGGFNFLYYSVPYGNNGWFVACDTAYMQNQTATATAVCQ